MRAVVSRVNAARVEVEGQAVAAIGRGYAVLLGVCRGDSEADADWMAEKIAGLRLFADDRGRMSRSLQEVGGALLVVSQFTLCGEVGRGRRPDFANAEAYERAEALWARVVERLRRTGASVATGRFGAHMLVAWENDGPVTVWVDSKSGRPGATEV
jgi:D-tyrosyl-tRNA(Tyr) deacylase